jgi:nicotinamidase-related amidase
MTAARVAWESSRSAAIIVDMWDLKGLHHCRSATERVEELAPAMNRVVAALRREGALIIHAPSDCMEFYEDSPARSRAVHATPHVAPAPFEWNWPDESREPLVPGLVQPWGDWVDDPAKCSCEPGQPSCIVEAPRPWTRQTDAIEVRPEDAVTDVGQEVFNLLEEREIDAVLVMGVHTNICVLSRDFGIRQLVRLGKQPILCRDLTDSFHRHPAGHLAGHRMVIEHVERYWCPTVTSSQLVVSHDDDEDDIPVHDRQRAR